jgi:hypothetical protein
MTGYLLESHFLVTNPSAKRRPAQAGKFDAVPMLDLSRQYHQVRE